MPGKPHQSALIPHEQEIAALRHRRPPTPYAVIAELLMERHGLSIQAPAIFKFVKTRSKGRKVFSYAPSVQTAKPSSLQKQKPEEPPNAPKPPAAPRPKRFEMPFSETYNLHRLSPEEAAARLGKLEEKENP